MDFLKLTNEPLLIENITSLVSDSSCGAISCFVGVTRDNFEGKKVVRLEYEAYIKMAEKEMKKICQTARKEWKLKNIAIYHRLGAVDIKEPSVIIAASSEHRKDSLEAVSFIIDALKASVPIWKKEVYNDEQSEWKRNKECAWAQDKKTSYETSHVDISVPPQIKKERMSPVPDEEGAAEQKPKLVDSSFIQILAPKEEIERRIEAFQKLKREELNILNIQEFCVRGPDNEEENSCARTSAIVLRSKDSTTHLKLTKVINEWGPQTEGIDPGSVAAVTPTLIHQDKDKKNWANLSAVKTESNPVEIKSLSSHHKITEKRKLPPGLEERLLNMEEHLDIKPEGRVPPSVFERLKNLENRILYLESLSPEYFNSYPKNYLSSDYDQLSQIKKFDADDEDVMMINSVDAKLFELKKKMKCKQLGCSA